MSVSHQTGTCTESSLWNISDHFDCDKHHRNITKAVLSLLSVNRVVAGLTPTCFSLPHCCCLHTLSPLTELQINCCTRYLARFKARLPHKTYSRHSSGRADWVIIFGHFLKSAGKAHRKAVLQEMVCVVLLQISRIKEGK